MDDDAIQSYKRAGKIAKEALELARELAKEGASLIGLAEEVEGLIRSRGAKCAFPINICINSQAAHYTPAEKDPLRFARGDLVKLDVGVHVNGFIADTAATVEISTSNWTSLIRASSEALDAALEMIVPGIEVGSIGAAIENAISARGFRPVRNLTGHSMEKNNLHAGITVPNVALRDRSRLTSGMAVAIEPFATDGKGEVGDGKNGNIFRVVRKQGILRSDSNPFLEALVREFDHLPFASRWCATIDKNYQSLLRKNWMHRSVQGYPILSEVSSGMVSQAEHSIILLDNEAIVYTR
ncbi:MAG: type II methionyl aminopeptidase [Thermoplasmata archaeon]